MSGGNFPGRNYQKGATNLQKIFLRARNTNLLWRYEILDANNADATKLIGEMEDDIFWDLSEINIELEITKSLRMTNMDLKVLPDQLSVPLKTQILDFSGNKLQAIPDGWFPYLPQLNIFRIASNSFRELPWEIIANMRSIRILDMRNNPWNEQFFLKFKAYVKMFLPNLQKLYI